MSVFISRLRLNPRSPRVLQEIEDRYELHRTIMGAFPDAEQGGPGRVLFRVDDFSETNGHSILVQSEKEPTWDRLRVPGDYCLEPPQHKRIELVFTEGQRLQFRLLANPTVKIDGRRLGIFGEQQQLDWLLRKAVDGGFEFQHAVVNPKGFVIGSKEGVSGNIKIFGVQYDGLLIVKNPELFLETVKSGIGSAKGFGFGLLSLARALA